MILYYVIKLKVVTIGFYSKVAADIIGIAKTVVGHISLGLKLIDPLQRLKRSSKSYCL